VLIQGKIDEKNGQQWQEILKKWDTRLSALFVSIDLKGDGNISYESFQEVSY
jgi:anti-anti-sigma regulatory factor